MGAGRKLAKTLKLAKVKQHKRLHGKSGLLKKNSNARKSLANMLKWERKKLGRKTVASNLKKGSY
jgi:hypothetical protein